MAWPTVVTDRNIKTSPLTNTEIDSLFASLVTSASADPVSLAFVTALQRHIGNRHALARDIAFAASQAYPTSTIEALNRDQYGNSVPA